jgi:DNA-binding MarR family transcriptional regulator
MKRTGFDDVIHAPNRLQICASLSSMAKIEFWALRELLGVSDSVLSKHLKVLEEAGYLDVIKRTEKGRQRTWLALNGSGRKAFQSHVKELRKIVG